MKHLLLTFMLFGFGGSLWCAPSESRPLIDADQITKDPQRYVSRVVRIQGNITRLFGSQLFTIESQNRDGDPDILVLIPEPLPAISANKSVSVVGMVKQFDPERFRQEYPWFAASNIDYFKVLPSVRQSPALIASSIRDNEGKLVWSAPEPSRVTNSKTDNSQTQETQRLVRVLETALQNLPGVQADAIDVAVDGSTVIVSGQVESLPARDRIVEMVLKTKGVGTIRDKLTIDPAPQTDQQIRHNLVSTFVRDPVVDRYQLQVGVRAGVVTLAGNVDSYQEKNLAEQLAREIKGVRRVENEIVLNPSKKRLDAEIAAEVKNALRADPYVDIENININVRDGIVNLNGTVSSAFEIARATSGALVAGVKSVNADSLRLEFVPPGAARERGWRTNAVKEAAGASKPQTASSATGHDEAIQDVLLHALEHDARIKRPLPSVQVTSGTVVLKGFVDTLRAKLAAEERARMISGVRWVQNDLKIRPLQQLDNQLLKNWVEEALHAHPDLDGQNIQVRAQNGVIYLSGTVESKHHRGQAQRSASRIRGVIQVRNNLNLEMDNPRTATINYGMPDKPDAQVAEDIREQLVWSPFVDADQVVVRVEDGVVTLTGSVDTWSERGAAEENAFEGGAVMLLNKIEVRD